MNWQPCSKVPVILSKFLSVIFKLLIIYGVFTVKVGQIVVTVGSASNRGFGCPIRHPS